MSAPGFRMAAPVRLVAVAAFAVAATLIILLLAGAPPLDAVSVILDGGVGSRIRALQSLGVWTPLMLCSAGLLLTFAAGLWNIGIEGQVVMGAIAATCLLRFFGEGAGTFPLVLGLLAGMAGGALWAWLSGALRVYGRVHEIFSGLGLNFVAIGLTLWLILGPWRQPGAASLSGTEPLPDDFWLPMPGGFPLWQTVLAAAAVIAVRIILTKSRWGLVVKASGQNASAAALWGLRPGLRALQAMAACGALAGLAGALQVTGLYHRLLPSISSGYGYTALLAVMMAGFKLGPVIPICFFFAILNVGSIQLPLGLRLDSSLAGVIQGVLALSVFVVAGLELRLRRRKGGA